MPMFIRMANFALIFFAATLASAKSPETKEILTNAVHLSKAPTWLTATRIEKVTDHVQNKLEWSIHRVEVQWFFTDAEFAQAQSMGPFVAAVTTRRGDDITVLIGPHVDTHNFDKVFGHELVHVIVGQKYKSSIPKWFEEGLANYYSNFEKVDYKWLSQQELPADVTQLSHPVRGSKQEVDVRYKSAQAIAEMLDKKCDLENLIRISLERRMEDYIKTYCEILDLNGAFRRWVRDKAAH
jgi:hypothetical protein